MFIDGVANAYFFGVLVYHLASWIIWEDSLETGSAVSIILSCTDASIWPRNTVGAAIRTTALSATRPLLTVLANLTPAAVHATRFPLTVLTWFLTTPTWSTRLPLPTMFAEPAALALSTETLLTTVLTNTSSTTFNADVLYLTMLTNPTSTAVHATYFPLTVLTFFNRHSPGTQTPKEFDVRVSVESVQGRFLTNPDSFLRSQFTRRSCQLVRRGTPDRTFASCVDQIRTRRSSR